MPFRDRRGRFVSTATYHRSQAARRYWRAVKAIQRQHTTVTIREARRVYRQSGLRTAADVRQHASFVQTLAESIITERDTRIDEAVETIDDFDDWLDLYEAGTYEDYPEEEAEGAFDYSET